MDLCILDSVCIRADFLWDCIGGGWVLPAAVRLGVACGAVWDAPAAGCGVSPAAGVTFEKRKSNQNVYRE